MTLPAKTNRYNPMVQTLLQEAQPCFHSLMHAPARELATSLIGAVLGELFGPLSLPPDEDFADRQRVDAASVANGNERAAALLTAAGLDGADFTEDDAVGLQSVLAAAVAVVERYELAAG
ncbi:hypothetical protein [Paraburkholderia agricolaris]|jgi:hypothetical protein|uniref:hypothetical protein n=1 Tax=Paraburkholderia agricolaris TaxID=2152888 RepID=UPI001290FBA9|nr:hypothetical protein [Paraburkholderia agricolaris]